MRVFLLLLGLVVLLPSRVADACGYWSMTDVEKKLEVGYLVNSATIKKAGKRVAAQYFSDDKKPLRVVTSKKTVMDIKAGKIVQGAKTVGTLDGNTITIGKQSFVIEFGDKVDHPLPSWKLVVKRGDTVVLESAQASSMCHHAQQTGDVAAQQDDIKRRIAFYLAWRASRR